MSNSIKVSTPEVFYDQLDNPQTDDLSVAVLGLAEILGMEKRLYTLPEISQALIDQSSEEITLDARDDEEVGRRIVGLLRQYPWLQPVTRIDREDDAVTSANLDIWAGNHLFDDSPGLFGITPAEGSKFRAMIQGVVGTPEFQQVCENIDATFTR